jgi:hypothetical protein
MPHKTKENRMPGLTPDQIQALLGKTRQKGIYEKYLIDFVNSNEGGINVNEEWMDLREKKATTLKQGFENAKDKAHVMEATEGKAANVKVLASDDQVYLINLANVEGGEPAVEPVAVPA